MPASVLPVAVVVALAVVAHHADSVLEVLPPLAVVLVAVTRVEVLASALADAVLEVALVDVSVGVVGGTLARVLSRNVLLFSVLSDQHVLWLVLLVCHCWFKFSFYS